MVWMVCSVAYLFSRSYHWYTSLPFLHCSALPLSDLPLYSHFGPQLTLGTIFFGIGTICIFNSVQNFYIDAFTRYAASAIAAGSLFRSLVGACFPLFGSDMYSAVGYGWGCTILAGAGILLMPMPLLIMKYGQRVRERFPVKLD